MAVQFDSGIFSIIGLSSEILVGAKLYWYQTGTSTPLATYSNNGLTVPNTNPVVADAAGRFGPIFLQQATYKFILKTSADVTLVTRDPWSGIDPLAVLAASGGSALVGYIEGGTSSVATTVQARLRDMVDAVTDYGCDNTGATNTTTQMKAFFDRCIATGKPGFIPAGTYKVTPGVLSFNCNFVDTAWPEIQTAGYYATQFRVDSTSNVDASIITITNGTATSAAGNYWNGGSLGGIFFKETRTGKTATHALSLTGIVHCNFGYMYAEDLCGDLLHMPVATFGGNPDPNAITGCQFEGLEGIRLLGRTITNLNGVGMDDFRCEIVRGIENVGGLVFGCGQGGRFKAVGAGNCQGWAWDDGSQAGTTTNNRTIVDDVEIDGCEYGIRVNLMYMATFDQIRINPRYKSGPAVHWPKIGLSLGEGTSPAIDLCNFQITFRLEAGGTKGDLGTFVQTNATGSGNMIGTQIDLKIIDASPPFNLADSDLYTGFTANGNVLITRSGKPIYDTRARVDVGASITGAVSIINSGAGSYAAATGIIPFNSQRWDVNDNFDPATYGVTIPYTGRYRINACIQFPSAVGTRVRLAVLQLRAAAYTPLATREFWVGNVGDTTFELNQTVDCAIGDILYVSGDQNTAAAIDLTALFNNTANNIFQVTAL